MLKKKKNPKYPVLGDGLIDMLHSQDIRPCSHWKSCCKGIFNDGGMFIDVSKMETVWRDNMYLWYQFY